MTYEVHANRKPWIFSSLSEANGAANDLYQRTGKIVAVTASNKTATHKFEG